MNSDDHNNTLVQDPNITKEISLKIFISIVSGVIGFWLSLHPFVFLLPPYDLKFIAGLVFPLVVSLEWGWRYGLLSAIIGLGAQVMWIKGGWESVVTYFLFVLWIMGIISAAQGETKPVPLLGRLFQDIFKGIQ